MLLLTICFLFLLKKVLTPVWLLLEVGAVKADTVIRLCEQCSLV